MTTDTRYESIEVRDLGFEILNAPDRSLITLELLANRDPRRWSVYRDLISIGDRVCYRVVGWDQEPRRPSGGARRRRARGLGRREKR